MFAPVDSLIQIKLMPIGVKDNLRYLFIITNDLIFSYL